MVLSEKDRRILKDLRKNEVLIDIEGHRFSEHSAGHILVFCGDGDQSLDLLNHHIGLMTGQREQCRPHLLALNGGALHLPPCSPVSKNGEGKVLRQQIKDAAALKGIQTVVLYSHAPCGAAKAAEIGLLEQLRLLMRAKLFIKKTLPLLEVLCLLHVDNGEGNKRTYFVSRNEWDEWTRRKGYSHLISE